MLKTRLFGLVLPTLALLLPGLALAQSAATAKVTNPALAEDPARGIPEWSFRPLTSDQQVGQAIWFMSAPNYRYHSYTLKFRVGGAMDFWNMLRTDRRYEERDASGKIKDGKAKRYLGRWAKWGLINDPDCCQPGQDCIEKAKSDKRFEEALAYNSPAKTFGLDYCLGDGAMIDALAKKGRGRTNVDWRAFGWQDPACRAPYNDCNLAFGQPTGAVGFRKFPNPRFEAEKWLKLNGGRLETWEGYVRNAGDGSLEPPYLIGMSCAGCHVTHNPVKPPAFADKPAWENLQGAFGSQYVHTSEIHSSGLPEGHPLKILFSSRLGITDTSAVPNDGVHNAGSMIAVLNFDVKPFFPNEKYIDPLSGRTESGTHRVLKGGEDSVNIYNAVQRVYVNIGVCAEECWLNNLTDNTVLDPRQRNFAQTPLDVSQCYEVCPSMRALTGDKQYSTLAKVVSYLASRRPTDLKDAPIADVAGKLAHTPPAATDSKTRRGMLVEFIETKLEIAGKKYFKPGDVEAGAMVFAGVKNPREAKCAACHSSQYDKPAGENPAHADFSKTDFWAEFTKEEIAAYKAKHGKALPASEAGIAATEGVRRDWLGNDELTSAADLGVNRCRSLHSNHMASHKVNGRDVADAGHVWQEYASIDYSAGEQRPDQTVELENDAASGGRGYFRNVSLLSAWATAPFLHNNSVGPELCLEPGHAEDLYLPAYDVRNGLVASLDGSRSVPANSAELRCWKVDPTPLGRIELYVKSMEELLNPNKRLAKLTRTAKPILIPVGPKMWPVADGPVAAKLGQVLEKVLPLNTPVVAAIKRTLLRLFGVSYEQIKLEIPPGVQASLVGNLDHKALLRDLFQLIRTGSSPLAAKKAGAALEAIRHQLASGQFSLVKLEKEKLENLLEAYNNCTDYTENKGHNFGAGLSDDEKRQLTAFLLTL